MMKLTTNVTYEPMRLKMSPSVEMPMPTDILTKSNNLLIYNWRAWCCRVMKSYTVRLKRDEANFSDDKNEPINILISLHKERTVFATKSCACIKKTVNFQLEFQYESVFKDEMDELVKPSNVFVWLYKKRTIFALKSFHVSLTGESIFYFGFDRDDDLLQFFTMFKFFFGL